MVNPPTTIPNPPTAIPNPATAIPDPPTTINDEEEEGQEKEEDEFSASYSEWCHRATIWFSVHGHSEADVEACVQNVPGNGVTFAEKKSAASILALTFAQVLKPVGTAASPAATARPTSAETAPPLPSTDIASTSSTADIAPPWPDS